MPTGAVGFSLLRVAEVNMFSFPLLGFKGNLFSRLDIFSFFFFQGAKTQMAAWPRCRGPERGFAPLFLSSKGGQVTGREATGLDLPATLLGRTRKWNLGATVPPNLPMSNLQRGYERIPPHQHRWGRPFQKTILSTQGLGTKTVSLFNAKNWSRCTFQFHSFQGSFFLETSGNPVFGKSDG